MKAVWDRIETWFAANAPAGYGDLRPGASADEIRVAEAAMCLKLPDDVVASYRLHDGQDTQARYGRGLVGGEGWRLLPLQEMVEVWGYWSRANPQDARYVPIADIGTGDFVFLNLQTDAEEPGCLVIQRRDSADPDPFRRSFSFWLEDFADDLEDGEFAYSEPEGSVMRTDEIG